MKKILSLIEIIVVYLLLSFNTNAKETKYFVEGLNYFEKENFLESKIHFERDIVFNPKNEMSYLYLAKIFNKEKKDEEEEIHLNNVLLINPNNDEAIYMLINLKIKQYDFDQAKQLIEKFDLVCNSLCSKKNELKEKLNKLTPKNEKNNN